jgi:hypothetical protein
MLNSFSYGLTDGNQRSIGMPNQIKAFVSRQAETRCYLLRHITQSAVPANIWITERGHTKLLGGRERGGAGLG